MINSKTDNDTEKYFRALNHRGFGFCIRTGIKRNSCINSLGRNAGIKVLDNQISRDESKNIWEEISTRYSKYHTKKYAEILAKRIHSYNQNKSPKLIHKIYRFSNMIDYKNFKIKAILGRRIVTISNRKRIQYLVVRSNSKNNMIKNWELTECSLETHSNYNSIIKYYQNRSTNPICSINNILGKHNEMNYSHDCDSDNCKELVNYALCTCIFCCYIYGNLLRYFRLNIDLNYKIHKFLNKKYYAVKNISIDKNKLFNSRINEFSNKGGNRYIKYKSLFLNDRKTNTENSKKISLGKINLLKNNEQTPFKIYTDCLLISKINDKIILSCNTLNPPIFKLMIFGHTIRFQKGLISLFDFLTCLSLKGVLISHVSRIFFSYLQVNSIISTCIFNINSYYKSRTIKIVGINGLGIFVFLSLFSDYSNPEIKLILSDNPKIMKFIKFFSSNYTDSLLYILGENKERLENHIRKLKAFNKNEDKSINKALQIMKCEDEIIK